MGRRKKPRKKPIRVDLAKLHSEIAHIPEPQSGQSLQSQGNWAGGSAVSASSPPDTAIEEANQRELQPQLQCQSEPWTMSFETGLSKYPFVKFTFDRLKICAVTFLNVKNEEEVLKRKEALVQLWTAWKGQQVPPTVGNLVSFATKKFMGQIGSSFVFLARIAHVVPMTQRTIVCQGICDTMTFLCSNGDGTTQGGQHKMVWILTQNSPEYDLFESFRHQGLPDEQSAEISAVRTLQFLSIMFSTDALKHLELGPGQHFGRIKLLGQGSLLFVFSTLQAPLVTLIGKWDGWPQETPGLQHALEATTTAFDWEAFKSACYTSHQQMTISCAPPSCGMKVTILQSNSN